MNTISIRLYPETEALYKRMLDECDAGTNGKTATADQFINYLLECAQNPRKIEVSKQTDQDEINRLKTEVAELLTRNSELKTSLDQSGVIPPGQILFTISDEEQQSIEELKPWLLSRGHQGTADEALYVAIKQGIVKR